MAQKNRKSPRSEMKAPDLPTYQCLGHLSFSCPSHPISSLGLGLSYSRQVAPYKWEMTERSYLYVAAVFMNASLHLLQGSSKVRPRGKGRLRAKAMAYQKHALELLEIGRRGGQVSDAAQRRFAAMCGTSTFMSPLDNSNQSSLSHLKACDPHALT